MSGLGTLIKHEFKAIGRWMIPSYGAFLAVSIIFGFTMFKPVFTGAFAEIISGLVGIIYFAMAVAIMVFTAVILIRRFYGNLLGNEGYLHFTLPISTNAHIANKTISAVIWLMLTVIAGCVSAVIILLLAGSSVELLAGIRAGLAEITDIAGGVKVTALILEVIVFTAFAFGEKALKIYAAISVGQLWSKHRGLGAVGAYVGFCIIECCLGGIMNRFYALNGLFENQGSEFASMQMGMLFAFIVVAIMMAIYWIVNYRILDRHLNLQ